MLGFGVGTGVRDDEVGGVQLCCWKYRKGVGVIVGEEGRRKGERGNFLVGITSTV